MGLILPQIVKIRPFGKNCDMLKEKGYPLPMKKATQGRKMVVDRSQYIDVHVLDLFPQSNVRVYCNCDNCGCLLHLQFCTYMKSTNNGIEKNYCWRCGIKVKNTGPNTYNWNSNLTDEERQDKRNYPEYYIFVKNVLARDNYICQCCGKKSDDDLEVHHLNGYNWDKEHRLDVTNGITLCEKCHENFHVIYGRGNNTKEQFEEWLGYRLSLSDYNEITSTPKIICLETGTIFTNITEAARMEGLSYNSVYYSCSGRSKICRNNGRHYEYYERYIHMTDEEIQAKIHEQSKYRMYKPILCLTTGEKFDNVKNAINKYNMNTCYGIYNSIDKHERYGHAGKIGDIGLDWMFYDDFNNLSNNDKKEIFNKYKSTILDKSYIYDLFN